MNQTAIENTEIMSLLQPILSDGFQGLPKALESIINLAMQFERERHLQAARYERTQTRDGFANGFKPKTLKTSVGPLDLQIPQVRGCSTPFYPSCLEKGTRIDRSVSMAIAEMYLQGVSTRRVQRVFEELCGMDVTSEQVSRASALLDEEVAKWRNRPIGEVKILFADATYLKVRVNGLVVTQAVFVVTGVLADGHRSILAVETGSGESEVLWRQVFSGLLRRGMHGVSLVVSDQHKGLRAALQAILCGVPWQRCQMHLQRNAQSYVSKKSESDGVASDIRAIFNAPSLQEARRLLDLVLQKYAKDSRLCTWLEENLPDAFTVYQFPEALRKRIRTNNIEENLNRQIKRRTNLITVFPNENSMLRLVASICMEISQEWEAHAIYLDVRNL